MTQMSQVCFPHTVELKNCSPSLHSNTCRIFITLHWICIRCTVGNFLTSSAMLLKNNRVRQAVKKRYDIVIRGTTNAVVGQPMQKEKC